MAIALKGFRFTHLTVFPKIVLLLFLRLECLLGLRIIFELSGLLSLGLLVDNSSNFCLT